MNDPKASESLNRLWKAIDKASGAWKQLLMMRFLGLQLDPSQAALREITIAAEMVEDAADDSVDVAMLAGQMLLRSLHHAYPKMSEQAARLLTRTDEDTR